MRTYAAFASVYDAIDLARAGLRALDIIVEDSTAPAGRVIDLGCGTGAAVLRLASLGWEVVGVDQSPEMLGIASARARDAHLPVDLIEADCLQVEALFEQSGSVTRRSSFDLGLCLGDTLSELTGDEDLVRLCRLAVELLRDGGRFAIECRTAAEIQGWDARDEVLYDDGSLLVYAQRDYNQRTHTATSRYVWLIREDQRWWRDEELHTLRAWSADEIRTALEAAGLELEFEHMPAPGRALYLARKRSRVSY